MAYDLELSAVIHALKMWHHHLIEKKFILMTDNKGLKYMLDQPNLNVRQARWLAFLSEYDFEIMYGRKCNTLISWSNLVDGLVLGPELLKKMELIVKQVQGNLKIAQDR